MRLDQYLTRSNLSINEGIERLNNSGTQILLVVDEGQKLLGTVTDGDIRRGILSAPNAASQTTLGEIMQSQPIVAEVDWSPQKAEAVMRSKRVHAIPVVNAEGCVHGIFTEESLLSRDRLPNSAVLMVGGLGTRLGEMTRNCPKPMLQIGGRPILQTIVQSLHHAGIKHVVMAVNYLADQIQDHFGDGSALGLNIEYVTEKERMGTAGALRLLPDAPSNPILVMNGDILTRVNFGHLLRYHAEHEASATMCVREFSQRIPFGVVELNGTEIQGIREKPETCFYVNSGIYVLEPAALECIPATGMFDMPTLFDHVREQGKKTVAYPVREYWADIGQPGDFEQAEAEYSSHFHELTPVVENQSTP